MKNPEIKVVHCREDYYDIYIGRGSVWGNPYTIPNDGDRDEVIDNYEAYIMNHPSLIKALPNLIGKVLGCWCAPKRCHGDILKIMVEDRIWEK